VRIWYPKPLDDEVIRGLAELVPGHVVSRDASHDVELIIDGRIERSDLLSCPRCRWLVVPFAGVPVATLELMRDFPQISVHNLHHNAAEAAETALALLFAAAKQTVPVDQAMRRHDWSPRYEPERAMLLSGKTAVLLGYGQIGRRIGEVLRAVGVKTIPVRRNPAGPGELGPSELAEILPLAEILIITTALTPETEGMIGAEELHAMPKGAILVNVARAQVVQEQPLYEALRSRTLHSAGIDVWYRYPKAEPGSVPSYFGAPPSAVNTPPSNFAFHELENLVMSPHCGGAAAGTEMRRIEHLARQIHAAAAGGEVPNRVHVGLGY
jgi:phosphoglycerate dehydrogenase-like enzyme